ncbi:putative porin [uncultured Selenomonas sp.]|uniref:putative porin n=1 Tax=uncultured Selenomonas sp. TaxID=159275 RepID=UPI0025D74E7F|nr:putative porin [uncultured Selenomonas sp.]
MKKTLVSALTTALVVGAASTTFAAANPFSDVPADHWAYDAVTQLAADGVIEGYGDTTFQGDKSITRYEMAQMVAKAMAKTDVSAADKAMIDKLAAEFADELNNLGVRVSNLEKHADMVKWTGKVEYTYKSTRVDNNVNSDRRRVNNDDYVFRLEPTAEVNDHWDVHARLDATGEMSEDSTTEVKLKRAWAQGNYKNFTVKLGKQALYTNEHGLVFDETFSGANLEFGKDLKATLLAGRISADQYTTDDYFGAAYAPSGTIAEHKSIGDTDTANFQGINLQYAGASKLYGGLGYYHLNSDAFKTASYAKGADEDNANIWTANLGYRFDGKNALWGSYANNTTADYDDDAWQVQYDYGNYVPANKGSWGAYAAYRSMGQNASLCGTYDGVLQGTKGWEIGAQYAVFKNVGLLVKYADGKSIGDGHYDFNRLFGRVELFF